MRTNTIKISLPVVILLFAGCSLLGLSHEEKTISYRDSGSVVLSRVAPLASALNLEDSQMLGFLPMQQTSRVGHWLAINKTKRTVEIMDGDQSIVELSADGIDKLVP
ncbi:MAG: hypothetical protein GYA55_02130, partial [SAR324 cluster bacterium]|nr:hypothetical protein [SAR324 cluster bacterium]